MTTPLDLMSYVLPPKLPPSFIHLTAGRRAAFSENKSLFSDIRHCILVMPVGIIRHQEVRGSVLSSGAKTRKGRNEIMAKAKGDKISGSGKVKQGIEPISPRTQSKIEAAAAAVCACGTNKRPLSRREEKVLLKAVQEIVEEQGELKGLPRSVKEALELGFAMDSGSGASIKTRLVFARGSVDKILERGHHTLKGPGGLRIKVPYRAVLTFGRPMPLM